MGRGLFTDALLTFVLTAVVHRIPMCAVSIGFTVNREYIIGVIYNPILNELFEATHTSSSKLNEQPIHVSDVHDLSSACISTEGGSDRSEAKINWILTNLNRMLNNKVQCVRMMGSCALNLAYLACGRLDVSYERGPHPWDLAAGVLIVRRAGGTVLSGDFDNHSDFELTGGSVLAYTPALAGALLGNVL